MRDWLRAALTDAGADITGAYLFGSVLDSARTPKDVDFVVVTADGAGGAAWHRVRAWRQDVAHRFQARFGLPLSVFIATPSEWRELNGTLISRREPLL